MTAEIATGRRRKAVVVLAGAARTSDRAVRALAASLREVGVETTYVGREDNAHEIAAVVDAERADAVELCLVRGAGGVPLLRELLRELALLGRTHVSIVVHRID